jgi:hypothetical protein
LNDKPNHLHVVASGGLDAVRQSFEKGEKHTPKSRGGKGGGGDAVPPPPPPPDDPEELFPEVLPPKSPVKALGVNGRTYYFLSKLGQFHQLMDKDVNMNPILGLFGGDSDYLREYWPKYAKGTKTPIVVNFDHGMVREVLIRSCNEAGIWSPEQNVRGVGTWAEDDGTLVMHCGDRLFLSDGTRHHPGVRGRLLYPGAPVQPHPVAGGAAGVDGPCDVLLQKVNTWNWQRKKMDGKLHVAWICAAMLGAAPAWRPIEWITGGSGSGKSTLMTLTRWTFGDNGMVKSEDATPAGIKQRVGDTTIPVSIDELEQEAHSTRSNDIMKLARIASSGGESLRGSPGGVSTTFVSRNAFQFSSIVIPSLPQQDKNRLFVGNLDPVEWEGKAGQRKREPGEDFEEGDEEEDEAESSVLGKKGNWAKIGQQLRGRLLAEWPRYARTLRAYRKALEAAGHNARGCDQFGSLGAAFDLAMYDGFEGARALAWALELPAAGLEETSGYSSSHESCLQHLMGSQIDAWKGGAKESIARLIHQAREEIINKSNDRATVKLLESYGIKVGRNELDPTLWIIAISNNHTAIRKIYQETDWKGIPGAPGAWSQMMARIPGAQTTGKGGGRLRLHMAKQLNYCAALPWEVVFPAATKDDDDDIMHAEDRDS